MHYSAHEEKHRFPQKLKLSVAIVLRVRYLRNTSSSSVTSAQRDEGIIIFPIW